MLIVNPWLAKTAFMVGMAALLVIPACIHRRDGKIEITESRKGPLEKCLLSLNSVAFARQTDADKQTVRDETVMTEVKQLEMRLPDDAFTYEGIQGRRGAAGWAGLAA